jgi:hypothetical protein
MPTFNRQSLQRLRLWIFATALIFVFVSALEALHTHKLLTDTNDDCVLCQHSASFAQIPLNSQLVIIQVIFAVFVALPVPLWRRQNTVNTAPIRAPPQLPHTD